MKKTSFYYLIVHKKSGKMLFQDCKIPMYWSLKVATDRCKLFSECKVIKIAANQFNNLIDGINKKDNG